MRECCVCGGAVVGLDFRWDGRHQHSAFVDCIAHMKWKLEQAQADAQRLTAEVSVLRGACKEKERVGDELIVENARLTAEVARLQSIVRKAPGIVRYDTHGWFVCDWCGASTTAFMTDKGLRCDPPFVHRPDCGLVELEALRVALTPPRPRPD